MGETFSSVIEVSRGDKREDVAQDFWRKPVHCKETIPPFTDGSHNLQSHVIKLERQSEYVLREAVKGHSLPVNRYIWREEENE